MITGFNTDVDYDGRIYHVQTEDKGRDNPVIESLVYSGGEIVTSRRTSYEKLASSADYSEAAVTKLMEQQHRQLIRDIRNGKFDPEGPKPFGYNIITNRSLDEVVLDYLNQDLGVGRLRLELEEAGVFVENTRASVPIRVVDEAHGQPVAGIRVTVRWISTSEKPRTLFRGSTDAEGRLTAVFDVPPLDGADAAVVCQAQGAGRSSEVKRFVQPARGAETGA